MFVQRIIPYTICSVQCTLHIVYTVHYTIAHGLLSVYIGVRYTVQCIHCVKCTLYNVQSVHTIINLGNTKVNTDIFTFISTSGVSVCLCACVCVYIWIAIVTYRWEIILLKEVVIIKLINNIIIIIIISNVDYHVIL